MLVGSATSWHRPSRLSRGSPRISGLGHALREQHVLSPRLEAMRAQHRRLACPRTTGCNAQQLLARHRSGVAAAAQQSRRRLPRTRAPRASRTGRCRDACSVTAYPCPPRTPRSSRAAAAEPAPLLRRLPLLERHRERLARIRLGSARLYSWNSAERIAVLDCFAAPRDARARGRTGSAVPDPQLLLASARDEAGALRTRQRRRVALQPQQQPANAASIAASAAWLQQRVRDALALAALASTSVSISHASAHSRVRARWRCPGFGDRRHRSTRAGRCRASAASSRRARAAPPMRPTQAARA